MTIAFRFVRLLGEKRLVVEDLIEWSVWEESKWRSDLECSLFFCRSRSCSKAYFYNFMVLALHFFSSLKFFGINVKMLSVNDRRINWITRKKPNFFFNFVDRLIIHMNKIVYLSSDEDRLADCSSFQGHKMKFLRSSAVGSCSHRCSTRPTDNSHFFFDVRETVDTEDVHNFQKNTSWKCKLS